MRKLFTGLAVFALGAALVAAALPGGAADHLEAPAVQADGRTDINDVYAFQSPTNAANTVLVMTVNPVAGVRSPTTFAPGARYDFLVDNNEDAVADVRYSVDFKKADADGQRYRLQAPGRDTAGETGTVVPLAGGGMVWAGLADDPFFFDLQAFNDQVKGAGGSRTFCDAGATDFFQGFNVTAIVLEVPSSALGDDTIGVWAQTRHGNSVIDRMGRPAIATALIPDGQEDAFNATAPADDRATWGDEVKAALLALSGLDGTPYTDAQAQGITDILLPDILTLDTSSSAGFLNGRRLQDDVIDTELTVVTGGLFGGSPVLTSDCVPANDNAFSASFPYLAAPNA